MAVSMTALIFNICPRSLTAIYYRSLLLGHADSMLGQKDRQQERGILDPLDRVRLARGQVEKVPRLKVVRLAEGGEGHTPLQALHGNLALGLVLLDLLARWDEQADDLYLCSPNEGLRLRRGQRCPQRSNVHDFARSCVRNGHCSALQFSVRKRPLRSILGEDVPPARIH